jgi:hypothetical protein
MSAGREIALSVGAVVLFGGGILVALDWTAATAMFPTTIGAAGLGLAIWAIAADILKRRDAAPEDTPMSEEDRTRARGTFVWIGVFFAAVLLIGFEWGVPVAALAFYRMEARLGWTTAVAAAGACGGFLYIAAHFLNIPLYPGLLMELIR